MNIYHIIWFFFFFIKIVLQLVDKSNFCLRVLVDCFELVTFKIIYLNDHQMTQFTMLDTVRDVDIHFHCKYIYTSQAVTNNLSKKTGWDYFRH